MEKETLKLIFPKDQKDQREKDQREKDQKEQKNKKNS